MAGKLDAELLRKGDDPADAICIVDSQEESAQHVLRELAPATVTALKTLVNTEGRRMLNALAHMLVSGNGQQAVFCGFALLHLVVAFPWQLKDLRLVEEKLCEACELFANTAAGVVLCSYRDELLTILDITPAAAVRSEGDRQP